jgi:branched-chain amino acid transport system ATP-binding protein
MHSLASQEPSLLAAENIESGYGQKTVLRGVTINIQPGEIVTLIGHNGAGKSTLLQTLFGLVPLKGGRILLDGKLLAPPEPTKMLRAGVAYLPQGHRVFTDFTVRENLEIGGVILSDRAQVSRRLEEVIALFPSLRPRLLQKAGTLSGGEKQLLALATALILTPRLLLLDEPSLGLAPTLVGKVLEHIRTLGEEFGIAALIVEQKVREVLKVANRVVVLRNGNISFSGDAYILQDEATLREVYL